MEIRTTIEGKKIKICLHTDLDSRIGWLKHRGLSITTPILDSEYIFAEDNLSFVEKDTVDICLWLIEDGGQFVEILNKLTDSIQLLSIEGKEELKYIIIDIWNNIREN